MPTRSAAAMAAPPISASSADAPSPDSVPRAQDRREAKPGVLEKRPQDLPGAKSGARFRGSSATGHEVVFNGLDALGAIFGTDDPDQANGLLSHCLKVLKDGEADAAQPSSDERPFLLAVVKDLAPRDAAERMLAVQMAVTHVAMIRSGRSLATCTLLNQFEAHSTNFNRLARTYTAQMEALRKHRTGGQQKVRVEHVYVHSGGQAIVGEIHHGGRGAEDER